MAKTVFLVCIKYEGKEFYYSHSRGVNITSNGVVMSAPEGVFTPSLKEAKWWESKWVAEITASEYEGAVVKSINQIVKEYGWVLK